MFVTICLLVLVFSLSIPHLNRQNNTHSADIWLNASRFDVQKVSLTGQNLKVHINLSANVANLVSLNTGIDISLDDANITIQGKISFYDDYF